MAGDEPSTPDLKRCSRCREWLPREGSFSRDRHASDGLKGWCKGCVSVYLRENREKNRVVNLQWQRANREKTRGYTAKWQAANREKIREYEKSDRGKAARQRALAKYQASEHGKAAGLVYRQLERSKTLARARTAAWRAANPERERENDRAHKKTEKGRLNGRIVSIRRRARKAEIPGDHTAEDVQKLLGRCKRCHLCGQPFTKRRPPTLDHVLAISSELGTNDPSNLALAHKSCNSKKQALRMNPITGQGILL